MRRVTAMGDEPGASLIDRFLAGEPRALARLVSLVEAETAAGEAALARLFPRTGQAHVVGLTGPPGAGKSTLVNALIGVIRQTGRRVGVIAVDPSSPLTGGAVLGDRVRMMDRHGDEGVFIRSMASRGQLGGIAAATSGVVHLLDAAQFPVILIETVGVGQDAVEIATLAHTIVVVQAPGLGDGIQSIKAGLLEIADLLVVNKSDRDGATELARQLRQVVDVPRSGAAWRPPVLLTQATNGEGVTGLAANIDAHLRDLRDGGGWEERTRAVARAEIQMRVRRELAQRVESGIGSARGLETLVASVADRHVAPQTAVNELLDRVVAPGSG